MIGSRMLLGYSLALSILKNRKPKNAKLWPSPQWILGHRGARADAPENTIAAFRLAMELGADGVEFDTSLSQDCVCVVIHDHTVERTTDGRGQVKDLTAFDLTQLNASKPIKGFVKVGVPSLNETLESLPDRAIANIELKFSGNFSKLTFVESVLEVVHSHYQRLQLIISSFDGELLSLLRNQDPNLIISLILSSKDKHWPHSLKYLSTIRPEALHLSPDLLSPMTFSLIRLAGLKVGVWTINEPKVALKLWKLGVDGIFTDQVAKIVKALRYSP